MTFHKLHPYRVYPSMQRFSNLLCAARSVVDACFVEDHKRTGGVVNEETAAIYDYHVCSGLVHSERWKPARDMYA